jgi:hypothetical protein
MKRGQSLEKVIRGRVFTGLGLYVAYGFERLFVRILRFSIQETSRLSINFMDLLFSSTLESMAIWNLLLALIFYITWKKKGYNRKRTLNVLVSLGFLMLFGALLINHFITDVPALVNSLMVNRQYFSLFLFERIYANQFSIFPVGAFAFFGAALGIILADDPPYSQIKKFGYGFGSLLIGLGLIVLIGGFDLIAGFDNTISPIPVDFINLGFQMCFFTFLVKKFDYRNKPLSRSLKRSYEFFEKFGNLSLTIYLFDGLLSTVLYRVYLSSIGNTFRGDFSMIIIFIQTVMIVWIALVKLFHRYNYKFSMEWLLLNLKSGGFLKRKKSQGNSKKAHTIVETNADKLHLKTENPSYLLFSNPVEKNIPWIY